MGKSAVNSAEATANIDDRGFVCGTVSDGNIVLFLYPALLTLINLSSETHFLLDLVKTGVLKTDGSEKKAEYHPPTKEKPEWSHTYEHEQKNVGFIFGNMNDES